MTGTKWEKVEGRVVDEQLFVATLGGAVDALNRQAIDYVLMGGLAAGVLGGERYSQDIDLMIKPEDAHQALAAMAAAGFDTQERDPLWLFKAVKDGVLVDLIFCSVGSIYIDDEMLKRAVETDVNGHWVRVMSAEDLVVTKVLAHRKDTPYQWHDALGLIARAQLDWPYLVRRARSGPRRVLSLLLYAQSDGLAVPNEVIRELFDMSFDREG